MRVMAMQAIGIVTLPVGVAKFMVMGRAPTKTVPSLTVVAVHETPLRGTDHLTDHPGGA
jgi:hypothetical protein